MVASRNAQPIPPRGCQYNILERGTTGSASGPAHAGKGRGRERWFRPSSRDAGCSLAVGGRSPVSSFMRETKPSSEMSTRVHSVRVMLGTSQLWEEGHMSSYFLLVKMSRAVKLHLAWPCLPVFDVETSITCGEGAATQATSYKERGFHHQTDRNGWGSKSRESLDSAFPALKKRAIESFISV